MAIGLPIFIRKPGASLAQGIIYQRRRITCELYFIAIALGGLIVLGALVLAIVWLVGALARDSGDEDTDVDDFEGRDAG